MPIMLNTTTTIQLGTGPTLNTIDGNGVVWRIDANGVAGLGAPATTLTPVQKVRAQGAWAGDAFPTGRTITVSGTIAAPTPALLNAAIDSLIAGVTPSAFTMTVTEIGVPYTMSVRQQGETLTQKLTNVFATYSINVFAPDSRKFGTPQVGTTFLPQSTGGATWPETWPESWPAVTVSGNVALTNPGNTTGSVVLRIDGPATGPAIAHTGAGPSTITFASSLILNTGEWLTINMDTHQVLANDQANRAQYITSAGWSGFDPGPNVWALSAVAFNAATKLTVTATPAKR